jgi:hypothetical protein
MQNDSEPSMRHVTMIGRVFSKPRTDMQDAQVVQFCDDTLRRDATVVSFDTERMLFLSAIFADRQIVKSLFEVV